MKITDFINNDLKQFSNYDNVRSIPSIVDGLKDAQRKAVHSMRKFGLQEEKVSRIAGNASIYTDYRHGETSMQETIINLAQNFSGSNNINLFEPLGQFGSILSPNSASARYISTKKSTWFDKLIRQEDDVILTYKKSEDLTVEPECFFPTLPLWLINGSVGIGTGHSVKIASRNHKSVIKVIECILKNELVDEKLLYPYFNKWKGTVEKVDDNSYELKGCLEIVNTTTIRITELPIGFTHNKYKEHLINLMDDNVIKDYESNSTEFSFDFEITCPRELTKKTTKELYKVFKLVSRHTDNITLWDRNNVLKRYSSVLEALQEWVDIKISSVEHRRLEQIKLLETYHTELNNTLIFITSWNKLSETNNMMKYDDDNLLKLISSESNLNNDVILDKMKLPIRSLTLKKCDELLEKINNTLKEINFLKTTTSVKIYMLDLNCILK